MPPECSARRYFRKSGSRAAYENENELLMVRQFVAQPDILLVLQEALAHVIILVQHQSFDLRGDINKRREFL
jgi:hypothetical protein